MTPERVPVFEKQIHNLPDDLYDYQKEDAARLQTGNNWFNFSEMGVGKTPEALQVCEAEGYRRVLIICPNSLRWEWARQIKEWTGEDAGVSLRAARKRLDNFFLRPTKYYVINYESFRISRYKEILFGLPWDCIIMDEAHKLKNPRSVQSKGLLDFCRKFQGKAKLMALTGTPMVNHPADLHTLLCMLQPQDFHPSARRSFIDRYCIWRPTQYGMKITGGKNLEELRRITSPYSIRRTKKEVLPFLPDKYFRVADLTMPDDQRDAYETMENELFLLLDNGLELWAPNVLALLTRLRQLNLDPAILGRQISSSKTEFLSDLVEELTDNGQKLVIFSCFATYIEYLRHLFKDISHVTLTGEVKAEDRARAVQLFQEDPSIKLAMGTMQAAGEGITLTAASNVILMDRWWSPAVNNQAIDRLHRISQKNSVQVIIPVNLDSIDESLSEILRRKEGYATDYFDEKDVISEVFKNRREERR